MNGRFWILVASISLGIWGCHGDSHLATDVNDVLLQNSTTPHTVGVTLQGTVTCSACDASAGMAIVVTSPTMGNVANGKLGSVGWYSLAGTAKSGDTLTIRVMATQSSGLVGRTATAVVPDGGGTITNDFQF